VRLPELIQSKLPPQFTTQPAAAERPRPLQLHFPQFYLQRFHLARADRAIIRKQAQGREILFLLVEDFQRFAPGGLLAIVDLP
jgi:hypothetical protein